ncbi:RNA-directed DNA polymerase, eukaryota, Reverse transcriptase [Salix suchowensis]|nr:RNA-directed DNA polymerase, eukaryota, Reverse transcriptase [Salix suchowensis]
MFGGKNIILQKWTPHFQFDRSKISHVSVWIRLRGLPLPLWTKEGLSMAASMVGKPQSCDEQTINCKRLDYARLCVELDASLPFIRQFEVESPLSKEPVKVTVEYEWKPSRCEVCHSFGHKCPAPEKTNVGGATPTDGEFQQPHGQLKAREETHTPDEASPRRQEAEGARHRSRSRPKQREGKQPWIEVSPPRQATKKVSDLGHQMSEPAPQTIPLQQVSESSKQSTVGTVGQKGANSRKDNQLCLVESQGQEGTPNTGMDIEVGVEEEGSSMPQGSHVSSEGDEPTTTSPAVRKKKTWNIRGLNSPQKQKSIHHWITKNNLDIVGILEARILSANMAKVENGLGLSKWQFISNINHSHLCRILVGWNPKKWISCDVLSQANGSSIRVTFVYGMNSPVDRRALWSYLSSQKMVNNTVSWTILGDFNAITNSRDRSGGDHHWYSHMDEYPSCITQAELNQIPSSGMHFTWDNGQHGENSILKKLNWVWGNHQMLSAWPDSKAEFQARLASDHSPIVLTLAPPPFRQKLRVLKGYLKSKLGHCSHDITHRVNEAKENWYAVQHQLDKNPRDQVIRGRERDACYHYHKLNSDAESFFKQRSRVQWLKLGDKNTAYFHRSLLHRRARNHIHSLTSESGEREAMAVPVTREEIREALFSIPDDKSPGTDGYNSCFFKTSWETVGDDFVAAVEHFFKTTSMPRCINTTRIILIPKVETPGHLNDYRPISCCSVIYKCISKIIAKRIKASLGTVISKSQSAFLPGRNISEAIFLVQELMHNYHRQGGIPRCAIKVDLRKAFDTLNWNFIIQALGKVGIHPTVINWIRVCITTPSFTVNINGEDHGFFQASRGLRQGDPLSPYLFVLAMEGLNEILQAVTLDPAFTFHWRCKALRITHMSFADDLILFSRGDPSSVKILKSALDTFSKLSGLSINHNKSSVFAAGVSQDMQSSLASILGISVSNAPPTYLGVPLITTRLTNADCFPLVDRIKSRIGLWTTATLSYAGREFRSRVGNGKNTFLWFDYWMPMGMRPSDILSQRSFSSSMLSWQAKVADIIENDRWSFPQIPLLNQQIWSRINFQPHPSREDSVVWTPNSSGQFTIYSAWEHLRARKPINVLHRLYFTSCMNLN